MKLTPQQTCNLRHSNCVSAENLSVPILTVSNIADSGTRPNGKLRICRYKCTFYQHPLYKTFNRKRAELDRAKRVGAFMTALKLTEVGEPTSQRPQAQATKPKTPKGSELKP